MTLFHRTLSSKYWFSIVVHTKFSTSSCSYSSKQRLAIIASSEAVTVPSNLFRQRPKFRVPAKFLVDVYMEAFLVRVGSTYF
jgi:hypothetical protein